MTDQQQTGTRRVADQVLELAQAANKEKAQRQKVAEHRRDEEAAVDAWLSRKRAVLLSLIVAIPIFVMLLVIDLTGISLIDLATPNPSAPVAQQSAQQEMDGVVKRIEAFHSDYNQLPRSLVEVGMSSRGDWTYATLPGGHYAIALKMYGQSLTYDSRQHKPAGAQ